MSTRKKIGAVLGRFSSVALLTGPAVSLCLAASAAKAEELHVYNWVDYIGESTIADFEAETGIKVIYDTYDSSETVDAKLITGSSGYDVVLHAGSFMPRLIQAGVFDVLDKSKLDNYANLDVDILKVVANWDEDNRYGIPYMWGTVGITYNVDMIKERMPDAPIGSFSMILDPSIISKFADCGVSLLDSPVDVIPMTLSYLGLDPMSTNPEDYDKVVEAVSAIRGSVTTFDSSNYLNALPNKERCIAMTWSGDYAVAAARAEEAGVEIKLNYFVPEEGAGAWFDMWAIPSDAPNKEAAYKWLNYMMRPEVIAAATNYTWYANANKAATPLVDEEIRTNPAVYPDSKAMERMYLAKTLPPKVERVRTRSWSRIKTGS
ncbi:polyamine ABC transporter substrate-binding protein [Kiloniella laminariae]|uniref:polyamine ABC transporter substrate-binding protein n=1 Tax=Kiloniella laminariae TaxID=454162 RepID=UPI0012FC543A|nr:polyamine ABC transporter substrate-binding protein [Kiloniella laminariae]